MLILKYTFKTGVFFTIFSAFQFTLENRGVFSIKMLILKYTFKTGVFSRFFSAFQFTLENRGVLP
jgi:hypothetical protein